MNSILRIAVFVGGSLLFNQPAPAAPPKQDAAARQAATDDALVKQLKQALAKARSGTMDDQRIVVELIATAAGKGNAGVAAVCDAAAVPDFAPVAFGYLAEMFDPSAKSAHTSPGAAACDLNTLDRPAVAAIGKVVPLARTRALSADLPERERNDVVALLIGVAPKSAAARMAVIDLLEASALSSERHADAAEVIAPDPAARKRLEAAAAKAVAPDDQALKNVVSLLASAGRSPEETAKAILALPQAEREAALASLPTDPRRRIPIEIELLADPSLPQPLLNEQPAAKPYLIAALKHRNQLVRWRAMSLLPPEDLAESMDLVASAVGASPELTFAAQQKFVGSPPESLTHLISRLKDTNSAIRLATLQTLTFVAVMHTQRGPEAFPEVLRKRIASATLPLLKDGAPEVRAAAVPALMALGPSHASTAGKVIADADDSEVALIISAIRATAVDMTAVRESIAGNKAAVARLDLAQQASFADTQVLLNTTAQLSPDKQRILAEALKPGTDDYEAKLWSLKPETDAAAFAAIARLDRDPNPNIRAIAHRVMGLRADSDPAVILRLLETAQSHVPYNERAAIHTGLGRQLGYGRARFFAMAQSRDAAQRRAACVVLALAEAVGSSLNLEQRLEVTPAVQRLLKDDEPEVRVAAARAAATLVDIGQPADFAPNALVLGLLESNDTALRAAALDGIGSLPPDLLQPLTKSAFPEVKDAAQLVLLAPGGSIIDDVQTRVPYKLAKANASSPSHRVRLQAGNLLASGGPTRKVTPGAKALLDLANGSDPEVATDALESLILWYGGPIVMPAEAYQFSGASLPKNMPIPAEVAITHRVTAALLAAKAKRISEIQDIATDDGKRIGCRWDLVREFLTDADPEVRAAAFTALRAAARRLVDERVAATGTPIPPEPKE